MIDNALFNDIFLNELFQQSEREIYARITALTQKEQTVESIEGRVSGGSINVDGSSAVRRSCSLNLIAKNLDINEFYWGVKNKFKLEIGLSNKVDPDYDDIIWFPQGIFLITNFDTSYTTKNYQISIKGKDKMCLLNGEFGGHFPHETELGVETYHDLETDTRTDIDIPIKNIIQEMVRNYGDELPYNIIINDIEDAGLELLEYRGNTPIYMFREITSDTFTNITFNGKQECYYLNNAYHLCKTTIDNSNNIIYDNMVDLEGVVKPTKVILSMTPINNLTKEEFIDGTYYKLFKEYYTDSDGRIYTTINEQDYYIAAKDTFVYADTYEPNEQYYKIAEEYYLAKFEQGSAPGYRLTDLTYAGDLIANAGDTVITILDKIKTMLGDFEYFYNLDGKFVFQKKQNYNSSNWHNSETDEVIYNDATLNMGNPIFNLLNNKLITSFKNTPKLENIKNDYSVWGSRKLDSGQERPIHARYAIDIKPEYYKSFDGIIYTSNSNLLQEMTDNRRQELLDEFHNNLKSFKMNYYIPTELPMPIKQSDGSYSAGWWDIRDWYQYYQLIKKEKPNGSMKWYSSNDATGCVRANSLNIIYGTSTPQYYYNTSDWKSNHSVWLLIKTPQGFYNPQHGSGQYNENYTSTKTLYISYINDDGECITEPAVPKQIKEFHQPYSGCNDEHTYLKFLTNDIQKQGNTVYFYNPNFPNTESTQDAINEQVQKEIDDFIEKNPIKVVDWREIIYQMAVDYRRYYHDDDFLYNIAQNNLNYYPTGVTGYERYYTDIISFWRDLYNPDPAPVSENVSYLEAFDCWVNDTLYLSNSYRKLLDKEKDEYIIDLNDLYVLDYNYEVNDNMLPETPEIVPFLGSQYCHLFYNMEAVTIKSLQEFKENMGKHSLYVSADFGYKKATSYNSDEIYYIIGDKTKSNDVYFYLDNKGNMNSGTDDAAELNSVNLIDIYMKERGPFITLEGYEDTYEAMEAELRNILLENYVKQEETATEKAKYNYGEYFDDKMEIRDRYYEKSSEPEVRMYYYVGGEVKPGDEWPKWEGPTEEEDEEESSDLIYIDGEVFVTNAVDENNNPNDNNKAFMTEDKQLFVVRLTEEQVAALYRKVKPYGMNDEYEAYAKHQFWVFKYPFGTKLNQYPDDYTNYAAKAFEAYLNSENGGWDNLYIKDSSPIKFSELDKPIQRLYYKQFGMLSEYINLLQYNNFNELKTNYTESILYIPTQLPSNYSSVETYIEILKNLTLEYAGYFSKTAQEKITSIYNIKIKDYETTEKYKEKINEMYLEYIDWLYLTYPSQMQKPNYKVEWIYYQNIYYTFNQDSLSGDYWSKDIGNSPEQLDFWFDFINGETSFLSRYSVQAIGPRTKVVNDTTVKAISYKEVPNTIFITSQEEYEKYEHKTGYTYIQLPQEMNSIFVTSSRGKSAKSAVEDLIYQHCYETNSVNLQTIPIYHLQPDTCIYIKNDETKINGDYIISKITVPLESKKMMSITATKVMPSII